MKKPAPDWSPQRMPTTEGSAIAAISSVARGFGSGAASAAFATGTGFAASTGMSAEARDLRALPASASATTTTHVATSHIQAEERRSGARLRATCRGRAGARSGSMAICDEA